MLNRCGICDLLGRTCHSCSFANEQDLARVAETTQQMMAQTPILTGREILARIVERGL